jgi:hypothetical protein
MMRAIDEHAHLAGERAVSIREHEDFLNTLRFGPLEHDEGVIHSETDDPVNAKCRKIVMKALVARQMALRAGGSESAGESEEDNPFARE